MPVDEWVRQKAKGWQAGVVERLLVTARKAAPRATVSIKWGQPVFELNGPFAFIKVAKAHVTLGFWRGAELTFPEATLEGGEVMKHLKIPSSESLDEKLVANLVRQAVALNETQGDPTARRDAKG
jgi:hypothetical protein